MTLPDTVSCAVGLNVTVIVWLCPGVKVTGKVTPLALVSVAFTVICEIVRFVFPLLVSVTLLELELPALTLPKARLVGFAESTVEDANPVPLKVTVGEFGALLVIATLPKKVPGVVGANVAVKLA